jgi:glycine dehydrogenase subunit 2
VEAKPSYDKLIFELSAPGRFAHSLPDLRRAVGDPASLVPAQFVRATPPALPEVSEVDVVRHYSRLSQMNYGWTRTSIRWLLHHEVQPKINEDMARLPGFARLHPLAPAAASQGRCSSCGSWPRPRRDLRDGPRLAAARRRAPRASSPGVLMIRAWHLSRGERRHKVLIPDSAHGTNPATTAQAGYQVVQLKSDEAGEVDLATSSGISTRTWPPS